MILYAKRLLTALLLCGFLGGSVALPLSANAATVPANFHYQRLFYYRNGTLSKASFFANAGSIDVFAPQVYSFNADGTLSGTLDKDLLDFAKKNKIKVMPLVTNGSFSPAAYQALLGDPAKEATAINALIAEAKDRGYWGWQIDFEQMKLNDKDEFSAFIAKAGTALHLAGLKLSVAVISKVSDTPSDYKNSLWNNLIGVYDYSALAGSSDFLSLMSYDDPESKGPIAPYPWLTRVLTYALAHVPAQKLSLGIPLYYWQWNDMTGKLVGIGGNEGMQNVFKNHPDVVATYNTTAQEPYLHYFNGGTGYSLWYENAKSVKAKIGLVKLYKLYGVSLWTLGLELPSIYTSLKE
jgi:spore germination protein YaaH